MLDSLFLLQLSLSQGSRKHRNFFLRYLVNLQSYQRSESSVLLSNHHRIMRKSRTKCAVNPDCHVRWVSNGPIADRQFTRGPAFVPLTSPLGAAYLRRLVVCRRCWCWGTYKFQRGTWSCFELNFINKWKNETKIVIWRLSNISHKALLDWPSTWSKQKRYFVMKKLSINLNNTR